jgi:hypothetical protein
MITYGFMTGFSAKRRKDSISKASKHNAIFYFNHILFPASDYANSIAKIYDICKYTSDSLKAHPLFKLKFGLVLADFIENKTSQFKPYCVRTATTKHNGEYPELFDFCSNLIDNDSKNKIIDSLLKNHDNFNSLGKKVIASVISKQIIANDIRAITILRLFYRNIKMNDFDILINKIPDGINNPDVKNILNKTKLFKYLQFDEIKFNSDPAARKEMIRLLAMTPTLTKRLSFNMMLSLNDLNLIAPAMRFKFIQYAFRHEARMLKFRGILDYNAKQIKKIEHWIHLFKTGSKEDKLSIAFIEEEDMKKLLFAVSLNKNEAYVNWISCYCKILDYIKVKNRTNMDQQ